MNLQIGDFCFVNEKYFVDFPDSNLMRNHEVINGKKHDRPYMVSLIDKEKNILWLVPISSKVDKYEKLIEKKIKHKGFCDTIIKGHLSGKKACFLIQNTIPVTEKYISNIYRDKNNKKIKITNENFKKGILRKTENIIGMVTSKRNQNLIFPNVNLINNQLENKKELKLEEKNIDKIYGYKKTKINIGSKEIFNVPEL